MPVRLGVSFISSDIGFLAFESRGFARRKLTVLNALTNAFLLFPFAPVDTGRICKSCEAQAHNKNQSQKTDRYFFHVENLSLSKNLFLLNAVLLTLLWTTRAAKKFEGISFSHESNENTELCLILGRFLWRLR